MKDILLAAATVLSLAATAAYADGGQGTVGNTVFTELPGSVAKTPVQNDPPIAGQNRQPSERYSQSSRGQWLFRPIGKYLDQRAGG